jgi:hypothetical protein
LQDVEIPEEYQISDDDILAAWGNANFGAEINYRQIILKALLQLAGGYSTGHTALSICRDLKLVGNGFHPNLTSKGRKIMYHWNKAAAILQAATKGEKNVNTKN